jgi:aspartate oxidase
LRNQSKVLIIGSGLAGLSAAVRLAEAGETDIAVVSSGSGGTPYIAALNAVLTPNPWGDTVEQHALDMLQAGYHINDRQLVAEMCAAAPRCIELLRRWGVEFAAKDGILHRRHASGSKYPRSLCQTTDLLGKQLIVKLREALQERGVTFHFQTRCVQILVEDNSVRGVTVTDPDGANCRNLYAPVVIAAWGGVGNLFPESTYPGDIDGRALALAYEAGASLIDLEFLEFEPMVAIWPPGAKGEPCPTAMLGEGAHLLNRDRERFLLAVRPQGEAGTPKTVINQAIWWELAAGKGSPHGGVYVDLRHIPVEVLKGYPWFYNRVADAGLDLTKELLEVGPVAHSYSGGMSVASDYQTSVKGLFAVGEAMGGIHGACRLAGNAATQALTSGVLGAEGILGGDFKAVTTAFSERKPTFYSDQEVREEVIPQVRRIVGRALGAQRDGAALRESDRELREILNSLDARPDTLARQTALSALLMARSAQLRRESRGSHYRSDYPELSQEWQCSIELTRGGEDTIQWRSIARP